MEQFDHKTYRTTLASELVSEENHKKRQRILRRAKTTNEYGMAEQLHAEDQGRELTKERESLYESLAEKIGNTPLIQYAGEVPNNNKVFLKLECENPFGHNHYDRVYLKLFHEKELLGLIHPGDNVFETSTGSAGISFAAIGRELGYKCHVATPAGGEKAREQAVVDQGAQIYLTPKDKYVNGFKDFITKFTRDNPSYIFMNHSMGNILGKGSDVNENAITSMEDVAEEVIEQLREKDESHCDYLLSAIGNGTNTLGVGKKMKEISPDTKFVGYESLSSAVAFRMKYPGKYEDEFDVNNTGKVVPESFDRHSMPGTSFPGQLAMNMPSLKQSIGFLDQVILVADEKVISNYESLAGTSSEPVDIVRWDNEDVAKNIPNLGRTTRAGVSVALRLATNVSGKVILVIAYDRADRYDQIK